MPRRPSGGRHREAQYTARDAAAKARVHHGGFSTTPTIRKARRYLQLFEVWFAGVDGDCDGEEQAALHRELAPPYSRTMPGGRDFAAMRAGSGSGVKLELQAGSRTSRGAA